MSILPKYSQLNLLTIIQKRDQEAFSILYDTYATLIFRIIRDEIRRDDTAEIIFRQVFLKLWKEFPNYDQSRCRLLTWAILITKASVSEFQKAKA